MPLPPLTAQISRLQGDLAPIMLRRRKEDVEKSIPPKEETIINVELTRLQKAYYRAIFERNRGFLSRGAAAAPVASLLNIEMELRKCCNHPFLLRGAEQREMAHLHSRSELVDAMVATSGKMVLLDKLLPKLQAEGEWHASGCVKCPVQLALVLILCNSTPLPLLRILTHAHTHSHTLIDL